MSAISVIALSQAVGFDLARAQPSVTAQSNADTQPNRRLPPKLKLPSADLLKRFAVQACSINSSGNFRLTGVTVTRAEYPADYPHTLKVVGPIKTGKVWSDYLNKTVGRDEICDIQRRIAADLYDRGVALPRLFIPIPTAGEPSTPGQSSVNFDVVEGELKAVRVHGDIGPVQAMAEAMLAHLVNGKPLNRFDLERYIALVSDLPGIQVSGQALGIRPGGAPTDFVLDITLTLSRLNEAAIVSNSNSKILGPWNAVARLDLNSLTAHGDRISFIAAPTLNNTTQEVLEVLGEFRLGNQGIFTRGSFTYGYSRPGDVLAPLKLRGDSYSGTIEVNDPIIRTRSRNLILAGGLDIVNQRLNFSDGSPLNNDALRVLWAKGDWDQRFSLGLTAFGREWNLHDRLGLELRQGLDILGASPKDAVALSRPQGRSDAFVMRSTGQLELYTEATPSDDGKRFSIPLAIGTRFQGQWADRPLLAYEEQAIGNLTIGRGYDPAAATGDRAFADETTLRIGPIPLDQADPGKARFRLSPYGFFDIARVVSLSDASQDVWVRSIGGGAALDLPQGVRVDLVYAEPLDRPFPSEQSKPDGRILLQISIQR